MLALGVSSTPRGVARGLDTGRALLGSGRREMEEGAVHLAPATRNAIWEISYGPYLAHSRCSGVGVVVALQS